MRSRPVTSAPSTPWQRTQIADSNDDRMLIVIFRQLFAALEHMHARGVLHRDIKPENIIFRHPHGVWNSRGARPVIIDFGMATTYSAARPVTGLMGSPGAHIAAASVRALRIMRTAAAQLLTEDARLLARGPMLSVRACVVLAMLRVSFGLVELVRRARARTQRRGAVVTVLTTGACAGYVAPEVINDEPHTPAVDMFAIGVVLYMAITGHRPMKTEQANRLTYAGLQAWEFPNMQARCLLLASSFTQRLCASRAIVWPGCDS